MGTNTQGGRVRDVCLKTNPLESAKLLQCVENACVLAVLANANIVGILLEGIFFLLLSSNKSSTVELQALARM